MDYLNQVSTVGLGSYENAQKQNAPRDRSCLEQHKDRLSLLYSRLMQISVALQTTSDRAIGGDASKPQGSSVSPVPSGLVAEINMIISDIEDQIGRIADTTSRLSTII